MPVPKKRHSNTWQRTRRGANWKMKGVHLGKCPECHSPILPHHACPSCGMYEGRKVIEIKEKAGKKKKEEKKKTEHEKAPAKEAPETSETKRPKASAEKEMSPAKAEIAPARTKQGSSSKQKEK
jgi:large subunit ribosomal protein L32